MTIGFPTNTVILIVAAMLAAGGGSWLSLSRGVRAVVVAAPARQPSKRVIGMSRRSFSRLGNVLMQPVLLTSPWRTGQMNDRQSAPDSWVIIRKSL